MRKILDKRGQAVGWAIFAVIVIALGLGATAYFTMGDSEEAVQTAQDVAQATKSGDVASIKVFVRDLANDDVNTKLAIATYCQGDDGTFVIDGTTSSATAEITGQTTIGKTVTCYAFDSTHQTMKPSVVIVDEEVEHVVIDAYTVSTTATIDFYDDTFTVADNGVSNITIASEGSDTYQKAKFTTTATDSFYPMGGFYVNTVESTNISLIDITGSAVVGGVKDKSSTQIVDSVLTTRVSARKSSFDFVFEINDADAVAGNAGNNPIVLDENDFIETGVVNVESTNSGGCGTTEVVSWNSFTKGYYREAIGTGIGYGHETDAVSAAVITADVDLDDFSCSPSA